MLLKIQMDTLITKSVLTNWYQKSMIGSEILLGTQLLNFSLPASRLWNAAPSIPWKGGIFGFLRMVGKCIMILFVSLFRLFNPLKNQGLSQQVQMSRLQSSVAIAAGALECRRERRLEQGNLAVDYDKQDWCPMALAAGLKTWGTRRQSPDVCTRYDD